MKDKLFYWSLILVVITLPLPKYNINSISIILSLSLWLIHSPFKEKYENLKENFLIFLIISSIFWMSLIGLIYTQDFNEGLKNLRKSLPFLIFPLILFSIKFKKENVYIILKYFSYSVIIASLFGLLKAFYFRTNNLGDLFYYDQLSKVLEKHTTYFALFIVVAITYFTNELFKKKRRNAKGAIVSILFLFLMLYMLSVRISIVSLIIVFIILSAKIYMQNKQRKYVIIFITILIPFLVYLTPNFQKRFNPKTPEGIEISDLGSRKIHWKAVLSTISDNNIFFGAGTGDGHLELYDQYRKHNFEIGYLDRYNAHNQFLESTLYFGIIGLFLLMLVIVVVLKKSLRTNNLLGIALVSVFFVFMLTESILERQSGIVLFAYIVSLLSLPPLTNKLMVSEKTKKGTKD